MKDANNQCSLDVAKIVQDRRNEFSVRSLDLKRKVCGDEKYVPTLHDKHEIVMYNDKIYVPQSYASI